MAEPKEPDTPADRVNEAAENKTLTPTPNGAGRTGAAASAASDSALGRSAPPKPEAAREAQQTVGVGRQVRKE